MKKKSGQILVPILIVLTVLGIMLPALVVWINREAFWTVKEQKSVTAFNVAEAGLERGLWAVKTSTYNWERVTNGLPISGYNFDATHYDVAGGVYRVRITSGPGNNEITILCEANTLKPQEKRAIEAVYTRKSFDHAISVDGALQWKPGLIVHWGPVVSYSAITQTPADWYPRKVSKGRITGRDTDPSPLNSDGIEYWAYQDLGSAPKINVDYYISVASFSRIPVDMGTGEILKKTGSTNAVATPPGSGIFLAANNNGGIKIERKGGSSNKYDFRNSTSVIYCDGTIDVGNDSFLKLLALVSKGDMNFDAQGVNYTATVPPAASVEYVKKKMVTPSYTYPGEGTGTYVIGSQSPAIRPCGMHGFLYCGGSLGNSGNSSLLGSVYVKTDITMNNFTVFYDTTVATNVQLSDAPMAIKSWKEKKSTW